MTQTAGRPEAVAPAPPEKESELGRGRGGPRCMSCAVEREAVG